MVQNLSGFRVQITLCSRSYDTAFPATQILREISLGNLELSKESYFDNAIVIEF